MTALAAASGRGCLRAVHNRAVDTFRRELSSARHDVSDDWITDALPARERTEDEVERRSDARLVRTALAGLPPDQRQVIELAYFGGFSHVADRRGTRVAGRHRQGPDAPRAAQAADRARRARRGGAMTGSDPTAGRCGGARRLRARRARASRGARVMRLRLRGCRDAPPRSRPRCPVRRHRSISGRFEPVCRPGRRLIRLAGGGASAGRLGAPARPDRSARARGRRIPSHPMARHPLASVGLARLRVSAGGGELIVTHLPPPPAGRTYQLWLQRGARTPAPEHPVRRSPRGAPPTLGLPGYAAGVTRVLVTIEPAGGSRAPTTRPVIVASLV